MPADFDFLLFSKDTLCHLFMLNEFLGWSLVFKQDTRLSHAAWKAVCFISSSLSAGAAAGSL